VPTVADAALPTVVALEVDGKVVSGVLISEVGLVLSTARPFLRMMAVSAVMQDGRRIPARLAYLDAPRNLALLRLSTEGVFPSVPVASRLPETGDAIFGAWNPGALSWSTGSGTLASRFALREGKVDPLLFRTRLPAPPSAEGGPVFDAQGSLLGVIAAGSNVGVAWVVSVEAMRSFLDHAGVYAPDFALQIGSDPAGADVFVDNKPVGHTGNNLPVLVDQLALGRHEVRLQKTGLADDVFGVELLQHKKTVVTRHLDPGGVVELSSNAPAEAWVDGALRGNTPLVLSLPSGTHWMDLRATGYLAGSRQVQVQTSTRQPLAVTLERIFAELSLNTHPEGAEVTANGQSLGVTPVRKAKVPAGAVELAIRAPDRHAYHFTITLGPSELRDLGTYRLEDPYGWLDPKLPPNSLVEIDGQARHLAKPYERLTVGDHTLKVLAPDYFAYETQVKVADAQSVVVDPPLALYDKLNPRRAGGLALGGLGLTLGLVSLGLATDKSTSNLAAPSLFTALAALGAGTFFLLTAPAAEESGWGEQRSWSGPTNVNADTSASPGAGAGAGESRSP
jgi:hypothetical protein